MKYALIIPDGAADEPQLVLGNKSPLQAARTPFMDRIARMGIVGGADHTPPALPAGSDVATMSLFGYSPLQFHTGRAPIEAAAQGIELGSNDWAIRCNFVTIHDGIMVSFTAEQIGNETARRLIGLLNEKLGDSRFEFFAGVGYRNLLIYRGQETLFGSDTQTTPPHDITDQEIALYLPTGTGGGLLREFMEASTDLFSHREFEECAATGIWLWGLGKRPALESFSTRYGKTGAMITAVDLLRGMARLVGWEVRNVPGATGYLDTNYSGKAQEAIRGLESKDFVVVHIEATDEASHEGNAYAKVEALEKIDQQIVGPIHAALESMGEYRILVSPDHPTFLRTKTHSYGMVPFAACGTGIMADQASCYDEQSIGLTFPEGWRLMNEFLKGDLS